MGHPGAVIMEVHVLMIEETSYEKSDAQLNFTSYKCAVKSVITMTSIIGTIYAK